MRAGRGCLLALVALTLPLGGATARAHLGHVVLSAERYLKLDASEDDTRLVVSLTLGAEEGRRVLEAADADHSGTVSADESDRYMREWGDGLRDELPVEIDGERVALTFTDAFLDPIGPVQDVPVTVEMVAHLPTHRRESVIVFHDEMVGRTRFDRTDVAFRGHDGAELLACGAGDASVAGRETSVSFGRAVSGTTPDTFSARIRYDGRAEEHQVPWPWIAAGVVSAAGLAFVLRRRKER